MTCEEKQLLLQDLCARLPYEVQCEIGGLRHGPYTFTGDDVEDLIAGRMFKPYLRPMSSMTEKERGEYRKALDKDFTILEDSLNSPISYKYADGTVVRDRVLFNELDWLNSHHFDFRGLIEKSLAIIAPEGMYES